MAFRPDYKQKADKVFAGCGLAAPLGGSGDELMSAERRVFIGRGAM